MPSARAGNGGSKCPGSKFTDLTDITVRPITSLLKRSGSGVAAAGTATSVSLAADFIPATTKAKFILSRSPLVQFADDMDYLLEYPYGCVEQTTSTAFPQLYFAELSRSVNQRAANRKPTTPTTTCSRPSANCNPCNCTTAP
jgi:uncharacterized protein YfaS (alpha-2-macroglobulin family)